ncbi:glycosyltransferase family 2 protein [Frigoribacterium sp. PhB24]|uniref:glycosyltransferase family 2 protein n=1 Tax=Frigoribacterium sp. PhB24 TaxID=2485204 RepID=UPI000F460A0B|nr:glycosyltransferase family A protein [Frigoribacterium sp. PhB24]ROS54695.1 glycosyl transferase family 2 [Frigoribacterium sp. PhB24]
MNRPAPRVSVVVCADGSTPFDGLTAALDSVLRDGDVHDVVAVVDRAPRLRDHLRHRYDDLVVVDNTRTPGLAGSRDTGIESARGDVVAFLAADCVAHAGWARALAAPFDQVDVIAVVGRTEPTWPGTAASALPDDLLWAVDCTPRSRPDGLVGLDDVAGATVAFRRWDLLQVGGLASGLDAREGVPRGAEFVELCLRLAADEPEARVVSASLARVSRTVHPGETRRRSVVGAAVDRGVAQVALRRSIGGDGDGDTLRGVAFARLASSAWSSFVGRRRGTTVLAAAAIALVTGRLLGRVRGTRIGLPLDQLEPLRSATVRR